MPARRKELSPRGRWILGIVLVIVGVLACVIGVIYFQVTADKLPALLGRLPGHPITRSRRGMVGLIAGGVLILAGGYTMYQSRFARLR